MFKNPTQTTVVACAVDELLMRLGINNASSEERASLMHAIEGLMSSDDSPSNYQQPQHGSQQPSTSAEKHLATQETIAFADPSQKLHTNRAIDQVTRFCVDSASKAEVQIDAGQLQIWAREYVEHSHAKLNY